MYSNKSNHHAIVNLLMAVAIVCLSTTLSFVCYQAPQPKASPAPLTSFCALRALNYFEHIFPKSLPHPTGSEYQLRVQKAITAQLRHLGLQPTLQQLNHCSLRFPHCAHITNILARFGQPTQPAILLMAHYDSVPAGPGASDDGHAVAALFELARLHQASLPQPFDLILLFSDAEEIGLLGSEAFVHKHHWAKDVQYVINLEARGTAGVSLAFEYLGSTSFLVPQFATYVSLPASNSLMQLIYEKLPNDTDLSVFRDRKVGGINLGFIENVAHYHTPLDNKQHLDLGSIQHQGDNAWSMLQGLQKAGITANSKQNNGSDLVFFDLMMWRVFSWSTQTSLLISLVLLILVGTSLAFLLKKNLSIKQLSWGCLAILCMIVSSGVLVFGLLWSLTRLGVIPKRLPFCESNTLVAVSAFSAIACMIVCWATRFRAYLGETGLLVAVWTFWVLLAVASAVVLPRTNFLFIVPACAICLAMCIFAWRQDLSTWSIHLLSVLPVLSASLLFVPLISLTLLAMGVGPASPALYASIIYALLFLPFATTQSKRITRICLLTTMGVAMLAWLGSYLLPVYSTELPQHVNITYFQDRCGNQPLNQWWAGTQGETLPAHFGSLGNFSAKAAPTSIPFGTERISVYTSPAPPIPLPPPQLQIQPQPNAPQHPNGATRTVTLKIQSLRKATNVALMWQDKRIQTVHVENQPVKISNQPDPWRGFSFFGLPPQGISVTLEVAGDAPAQVWLLDRTFDLPAQLKQAATQAKAQTVPCHRGDTSIVVTKHIL